MPAPTRPLRPNEFEILLTIAQGERHGYAIILETEARSGGGLQLGTGTLYRALRRLVQAGLAKPTVRRRMAEGDDERRRYYAITSLGREVAARAGTRTAHLIPSPSTQ